MSCVVVFNSLGYVPRSGTADSYGKLYNPLRSCQTFPWRLHHFLFPPAVYEGSNFPTVSPTLVIVHLLTVAILVRDLYFPELQYFLPTKKDLGFRKWHPFFKGPHPSSPTFLPTLAQREKTPLVEEE